MKKVLQLFLTFTFLLLIGSMNVNGATLNVPGTYPTIQAAVTAASPNDVILVASGTYPISATISINVANLTITGAGVGNTYLTGSYSTGSNFFSVTASGFTIQDVEIIKTDKTGEQNLIYIGASNTSVLNSSIHGQFVFGDGDVSRAMVVSGGLTGLLINGNTFYGLRQPGYFSGITTGTISNNYTYGTKGWVLEGGNMTFSGNTWGINVYDIAILNYPANSGYYTDIIAMSAANNDAVIEDQRVSPFVLSVVNVDGSTSYSSDLGGKYHPYSTITPALTRVVEGGKILVAAGTYNEEFTISKSSRLYGAGSTLTTVSGPIGGAGTTIQIAANNVLIDGFKITRDGNTVALWTAALNSAGLAIQGQAITNAEIRNCNFFGNRTGIDINNSNGHYIHDNIISNNRTGFIFRNQTDNLNISYNLITDNWTVGILFLDGSNTPGSNVPVQTAANCQFYHNTISGNWYGQVVDRQAGGSILPPGSNIKNFEQNYWGTMSPVVSTANSTEPGYNAQIPVIFGGTATAPGGQPDICGPASANIDYIPWCNYDFTNCTYDYYTPEAHIATPVAVSCSAYDVNITVKDFTNVGAISMKLNYDPLVLAYASVTLNPAISSSVTGVAVAGQFALSYQGVGVTLADDDVLFTLHFNLLPAIGGSSTSLTWSTVSGDCELAAPGGEPIYVSSFFDLTGGWTIPVRPVKNLNTGLEYCTIQAAIDAVPTQNNHVITVAAGTYNENIMVTKTLDIRGANYLVDPNTGSRGAESVIHPATSDKYGEIIKIRANNVSIDGFTIDGDNPSLISGIAGTNGADLDAAEAVTVYVDNINNLHVSNNIIQNLTYFGVTLYGASFSAPATSGHEILNNRFLDLGTYLDPDPNPDYNMNYWGGGILLYNNQYAKIAYNVIHNVRMGIQTGNFSRSNPGLATFQVIDHNTIDARRRGIFHNLQYGPTSGYTLSNNTISAISNSNETNFWDGIFLCSLSVPSTCTGNVINGAGLTIPTYGYQLWNVSNTAPPAISGGSVSNTSAGIFANNWEGYGPGNATSGAYGNVSSITLAPLAGGIGIYLHDNPLSTHAGVQLTLGAGIVINGGTRGLVIEGSSAKVVSPLNNLAFNGQTGKFIQLISNANDLDATAATFNSKLGSAMTNAELFATEDMIDHKIDLASLGFVTVKVLNDYVTVNSFVAPNTTPLIQRGIDAAANGWTVNVAAGTFYDGFTVNKPIIVDGDLASTTIIDLSGNVAAGNVASISNVVGNVTVRDFKLITGPASSVGSNALATSNNSGGTVSLLNNILYCVQSSTGTPKDNFGLIAGYNSTSALVFDGNAVYGGGDNPVLLELQKGATTFTNNQIFKGPDDSAQKDAIFCMNYGSTNITTPQLFENNTIDMSGGTIFTTATRGTGISVVAGFTGAGPGGYTDVTIRNNQIINLKNTRRGIGLWSNAVGGNVAAVISGNTISSAPGHSGQFGIDVIGPISGTQISNNDVSGVDRAFSGRTYTAGSPSGVQLHNNSLIGAIYGIDWTGGSGNLNATCNWYGTNTVAGVSGLITGSVTYSPWLINGSDIGDPGFVPGGACSGATDLYVNDGVLDANDIYTTAIGNDANPGTASAPFLTISKAVSEAMEGTTIWVDAGTFQEQVIIGKSVNIIGNDKAKTFVSAPATLTNVTWNNAHPIIYAYGNTNTVNISKLTIDGNGGRTTSWFVGALYYDANGTFDNCKITGIHDAGSFSGAQMGHAFYGTQAGSLTQTLAITNNLVDDYQKGGIYVRGTGTTATITGNTVTGQNVAEVTAQNGICVMLGAKATVTGNIVTNNIWNKVEHPHTWTSSGILIYQPGLPTGVSGNTLSGNEIGLSSYLATGTSYGVNTFANSKIHLWLDGAGDVNAGNIYDKKVLNNTMPEAVFGCIQYAVDEAYDNATSGVVLTASNNDFIENVTVFYGVTIQGGGIGLTKVYPAVTNPNCGGGGGGSLCAGSSNVFLVQANNVTIQQLTVDGDNPGISTPGYLVDARNGIITNHPVGVFNNLNVNNVEVKNIYLRGMYASSGGSFNFHDNIVSNVTGEAASIAMFNFGGAGAFTNNTVSNANDAIASNWSTGTTYSGNIITNSGSGIHTDNCGGADVIENNSVSNSPVNGYGIFVFAPYQNVIVRKNTITNVEVGLTCAGANPGVLTTFTQNVVDGQMKANSIGVYSTTEIWGYGSRNQNAIFTENYIKNNVKGFLLASEAGFTNTTTANGNSITGNTLGVKLVKDYTEVPPTGNFALDFTCNWWGSMNASAVPSAVGAADPPVDYTPWLVDGGDANSSLIGFQPNLASCYGSPISLVCALDQTEASCQNQTDINTKFAAWLLTTTASGCNGVLSTVPATPVPPAACGGSTLVQWTYTSDCGVLTCSATFTVTTAPVVEITCPSDKYVTQADAKDPYETGYPVVTNCINPSTVTFNDNRDLLNLCNSTGYITRTWSVTNYCTNTATCQQKIYVSDAIDPVITCPTDITVNTDPGLCSAVVNYAAPVATDFGYFQGFENPNWLSGNAVNSPSTDWNDYESPIARVTTGTDGIDSKSGSAHAVINSTTTIPTNTTGAFCREGGYNGTFGLGFVSKVDVYFNMDDPKISTGTYGWDLDQAVSTNSTGFLRDFVYHVGGNNTGIYVCVSNNSSNAIPGWTPAYIQTQPSYATITSSGWYTMEWETRNIGGFLAVDFNIRNAAGSVIWTKTQTTTDAIAGVGGNRYLWFNFISAEKLAIDNTSLTRKLPVTSLPASGTAFAKGTTTVTGTTSDACNRTTECSFNVTVLDNQAPQISTCPPTTNIEGCSTAAILGLGYSEVTVEVTASQFASAGGAATDNCAITYYAYIDISSGTCPITVTRTWTLKDEAGNTTNCVQTILVDDNTAPVITVPSTSLTMECFNAATVASWTSLASALDACDGVVSVTPSYTPPTGVCETTVEVTFTAVDACGNIGTATKSFTIDHVTPPVVPTDGASTVQCLSSVTTPTPPSVVDVCGTDVPAVLLSTVDSPDPLTCEGTRTYTYTYTDCSSLVSTWKYVYTIDHTLAPVVPANGAKTVACPVDAVAPTLLPTIPDQQQLSVNTGMQTPYWNNFTSIGQSFTCGTSGWLTKLDVRVGTLSGPLSFTLQIYQGNGIAGTLLYSGSQTLTATGWQSMNIAQNVAPYLTAGQQYTFWLTSFTYNQLGLFFMYPNAYNGGVSMDGCTSGCTSPYTWQQWPDYDLTFKTYMSVVPIVTDVCGAVITTPTPVISGTFDGCEGTKIYTYTYTDCSSLSTNWSYTYTIERNDFTMPVNGSSTVACIASATQPTPPTVNDNCGSAITPSGPSIGGTYNGCSGTRTYTWTYADCEGNTHNWVYTYTISPPVVTMPGSGSATVSCPSATLVAPVPPAVYDNCGRLLSVNAGVPGTPPVCNGTMTWTFTYTDCANVHYTWLFVYSVVYSSGLTAPTAGATTVSCPSASQVAPPLSDITDACGRTVSPVYVSNDPAPTCNGDVVWHYTYTACDGTTTVPWTYTYHVVYSGGLTAPPAGATTVSCPAASQVIPPLSDISDACGRMVSPVWVSNDPAPTCNGDVVWHYKYTACDGTTTVLWTYTYHVVYSGGLTAPTAGAATVSCPAASQVAPPLSNITDACGRTVSPVYVSNDAAPECNGEVVWYYTYTACDGITTVPWTFTYHVIYSGGLSAPTAGATTVSCPSASQVAPPLSNITDACGRTVSPVFVSHDPAPTCNGNVVWHYTYTACDGVTTVPWTYTYHVVYSGGLTAPTAGATTVSCPAESQVVPPLSNITDACGRTVSPVYVSNDPAPACNGDVVWHYTYTACDGVTTVPWTYTYHVVYSGGLTAPANGSATVAGPAQAVNPGPPANITDACGRSVSPVLVGSSTPPLCEGTVVWTYRYTACDGTTTADWTYTYTVTKSTLSGIMKYNNSPKTIMNNVTLKLVETGATCTTSGTGFYSFPDLCPGTYTLQVTNNNKGVGGINSTDAGAANSWPTSNTWIEHVKFLAGDVSNNNFINATDAQAIQQYFVYGTPFGRSNWSYWKAGDLVQHNLPAPSLTFNVVVTGNVTNYDLYAQVTGDFNGSFTPSGAKSTSTTLTLVQGNHVQAGAGQALELPIRATSAMEVGAVSMIITIPSELVEVTGVEMIGSTDPVSYAVNGNELRIGWNSLSPVNVQANGDLLVLKLKTTAAFVSGQTFTLALNGDPLNELADGSFNVIEGAVLSVDVVDNMNVGIITQVDDKSFTLSNYPNPFSKSTTVVYNLPVTGKVHLDLYNELGQHLTTLVDATQTAGHYTLKVDGSKLQQGMYSAILKLSNDKVDLVRSVKFIVIQ